MSPIVTVIMPVFNGEKYLDNAISSVLNQSFTNFKFMIINDGSTDNSAEVISTYEKQDSRIISYNLKNNLGVSAARNYCLSRVDTKYIYFLDADDVIHKDLLEKNIFLLEKYSSDLVIFGFNMINSINGKKIRRVPTELLIYKKTDLFINYKLLEKNIDFNSLWNKLYKTKLIIDNNIKFSNKKIGEDAVFNYNYLQLMDDTVINPNIYYDYTYLRNDSAMNKYNESRIEEKFEVVEARRKMLMRMSVPMTSKEYYEKKINILYYEIRNIKRYKITNEEKNKNIYSMLEKQCVSTFFTYNLNIFSYPIKTILKFIVIKKKWREINA